MLKNIFDYLSLLSLIVFTANALHMLALSILRRHDEDEDRSHNRLELLRDYLNNEDE